MDFYELKNKYFSLVRKKMINDYKMGNIDFMESEELLDHIIERPANKSQVEISDF